MTILEAAEKWNVKQRTVRGYIAKGYILKLQVDNNIISQEHFEERLKALEKIGCIYKRDENCNDYSTNMNFVLNAEKAAKELHIHLHFGPSFSVVSI